jgi:hypothetical protein
VQLELARDPRAGEGDLPIAVESGPDAQEGDTESEGRMGQGAGEVPEQDMDCQDAEEQRQQELEDDGLLQAGSIPGGPRGLGQPEDPVGLGRGRTVDEQAQSGDGREGQEQRQDEKIAVRRRQVPEGLAVGGVSRSTSTCPRKSRKPRALPATSGRTPRGASAILRAAGKRPAGPCAPPAS